MMAVFNNIANQYDEWYSQKKGAFVDRVETDLAFGLLKLESGMKVLDVGCGTGIFSMKLAEKGCIVTGIDVSEGMLKVAREKAAEKKLPIFYHQMDATDLAFEDGAFDAVLTMAAVEFIEDTARAVEEMFRVVKNSGQLLIGTINADSDWGDYYQTKKMQGNSIYRYAIFKTIDDLKAWNPEKLVGTGACLFISPFAEEEEFTLEREKELSETRRGGYICALWRK
ncbi:methyltransferase type 11 [Trichococcus pasteurii]|uniref:Methyltransferase type 11 n=2 Tax=Trichococcus pasteurii TaxID=43064 RepID=A0A1W1IHI8_9LACT|nr:ubiquinone biosynthesis O-methyltransferase [Trichococcus pasteurii]SLM52416.1 methyltransferase type 11 [Trichococcus pasteurii]SSB93297.1 methyltransferase type 11 [Trichococcus pasteurii]